MRKLLSDLKRNERGVSALEYAILAAVIVGAVVAGVTLFKGNLTTLFTNAGNAINEAAEVSTPATTN